MLRFGTEVFDFEIYAMGGGGGGGAVVKQVWCQGSRAIIMTSIRLMVDFYT